MESRGWKVYRRVDDLLDSANTANVGVIRNLTINRGLAAQGTRGEIC